MKALFLKQAYIIRKKYYIVLGSLAIGAILMIYIATKGTIPFHLSGLMLVGYPTIMLSSLLCYYYFYEERKGLSIEKSIQFFGVRKIVFSSVIMDFLVIVPTSLCLTLLYYEIDKYFSWNLVDLTSSFHSFIISVCVSTAASWLISLVLILTDSQPAATAALAIPMCFVFLTDYYIYFILIILIITLALTGIIIKKAGRLF